LTGTAQVGQPLGLTTGTWTGLATITYTYQWQISSDGGITWSDITGATATTYTPPAGSAGKQVRVLETGTNPDGSSQAASPASATIVASPPAPTVGSTATTTPQPAAPAGKPIASDVKPIKQHKPKRKKPKHGKPNRAAAKQRAGGPKTNHAPQPPGWHLVPR
jgi:hypothetical protein